MSDEPRKFYDFEYSMQAEGQGFQRVYLDEIEHESFTAEAEEDAREYIKENPEIEYDVSGDWIVDSDSIEIVDIEASDTSWICCICKSEFPDGYGNNPHPVKEDIKGNKINYMLYSSTERCCDLCNTNYVIPARFKQAAETNKLEGGLW